MVLIIIIRHFHFENLSTYLIKKSAIKDTTFPKKSDLCGIHICLYTNLFFSFKHASMTLFVRPMLNSKSISNEAIVPTATRHPYLLTFTEPIGAIYTRYAQKYNNNKRTPARILDCQLLSSGPASECGLCNQSCLTGEPSS